MCHHHSPVEIKQTQSRGRGLFVRPGSTVRKGQIIADYTVGTKRMTESQFKQAYPSGRASHVLKLGRRNPTYYDASNPRKSVSGMANRANSDERNNAKLSSTGKLVATRKLRPGTEILLAYGSAYRL